MLLRICAVCILLTSTSVQAQLTPLPTLSVGFPDFNQTNEELKKLREEIKELNKNLVHYGDLMNSNWGVSNAQFTRAIDLAEERYTIGAFTGIAIAAGILIGVIPALVNLGFIPLHYRVARNFAQQNQVPL